MERRVLNLASVKIVVLDEADRMLDMGFMEDVEYHPFQEHHATDKQAFSAQPSTHPS